MYKQLSASGLTQQQQSNLELVSTAGDAGLKHSEKKLPVFCKGMIMIQNSEQQTFQNRSGHRLALLGRGGQKLDHSGAEQ